MTDDSEPQRFFCETVLDYCKSHGFTVVSLSDDWVFQLRKSGAMRMAIGYDLGLNSSATYQVCRDKAATAAVLEQNSIRAVAHTPFLQPQIQSLLSQTGNWQAIRKAFMSFKQDVVAKPNEGTGLEVDLRD